MERTTLIYHAQSINGTMCILANAYDKDRFILLKFDDTRTKLDKDAQINSHARGS